MSFLRVMWYESDTDVVGGKVFLEYDDVIFRYCGVSGMWLKRLRFERYGVKTGEKANTHNQHWLTSTRFSPFSAQATISVIQVQRCSKLTHDDRSRS